MKMSQSLELNEVQLENIRKLARDMRRRVGFADETPIANDIFTILDQLDIMLLEYPITRVGDRPAFSAAMIYSQDEGEELVFIGVNTADYFDKQLFSIAHELYHYETKTGSHLSRLIEEESNLVEVFANRYAAELLLPANVLEGIVIEEFRNSSLKNLSENTILRFIARLQCNWWLPFKSLVRRLEEIGAISKTQYKQLYQIDERNMNEKYGKIGLAINNETFLKLNTQTKSIGTSPNKVEIIIRNFEDSLIDEDKFYDTLKLFNKSPGDYGYDIKVSDEDIDELNAFFDEEDEDEG